MFGERVGMCGSRKASGWSYRGSWWELCKNSFPCENPALLDSGGAKKKITTKVFLEASKIFGRLFYKHFATYAYLDFVQD